MYISNFPVGDLNSFSRMLQQQLKELEKKGHTEDEVVAVDFESDSIVFYLTSGDVLRVPKPSNEKDEDDPRRF